jgi:hypothetical protein
MLLYVRYTRTLTISVENILTVFEKKMMGKMVDPMRYEVTENLMILHIEEIQNLSYRTFVCLRKINWWGL